MKNDFFTIHEFSLQRFNTILKKGGATMEFIKRSSNNMVVTVSSCNNACGGDCTNKSDVYSKQVGSSKKS